MNRNGSTTPLEDRREHVYNLRRFLARNPGVSIREACRQIDPSEPDALRCAYQRYQRSERATMARITRATLAEHPARVLDELADHEIVALAQAVLDHVRIGRAAVRRQVFLRFAAALNYDEARLIARQFSDEQAVSPLVATRPVRPETAHYPENQPGDVGA